MMGKVHTFDIWALSQGATTYLFNRIFTEKIKLFVKNFLKYIDFIEFYKNFKINPRIFTNMNLL